MTNRRVNALENVTIPKIEGVLAYIGRELDELEREGMCTQGMEEDALFEPSQSRFVSFFFFRHDTQFSLLTTLSLCTDFTRLKLVQGKKEQEQVKQAKEMAKKKLAAKIGKENEEDITAAFDAADDQDVVF